MAHTRAARRTLLAGSGLALFLALGHLVNDVFQHMLPVLLPTLQLRFELSETVLALMVAALSFSSSVLQPVGGALADRFGKRLVGSLGVIACVSLLSLVGIAPSALMVAGLLLIGGLGSAAFHPAGMSMVRGVAGNQGELFLSIFIIGGTIAAALSPVTMLYIIRHHGLEAMPYLMIPGVIVGALMYLLIPPQPRAPRDARPKLFAWDLLGGPLGLLCLSGIFRTMAWVSFINGMPLWLVAVHGVPRDATVIGLTVGLFMVAGGSGTMLSSLLAKRLGRRKVITGAMLLAFPALMMVLQLPPGTLFYYLFIVLGGVLTNAALPLMIVSAQDLAPHAVATASGLLMGFTWGTAGVIYIGIGALQETIGFSPALAISYVCLVPAALIAFYVLGRQRANVPAASPNYPNMDSASKQD